MFVARLLALCALALPMGAAFADRVEIPLRVPLETVRQALNAKLSSRDAVCGYLKAEATRLVAVDGRLRADLAVDCRNAGWRGSMQLTLLPRLDAGRRLRVQVVDSRGANRYLLQRLEQFSYDVGGWRETLIETLRNAGPAQERAELETVLAQLELGQPGVDPGSVVVPIALEVPDRWLRAPTAGLPPSPLTEAELEALDKALQPWDAFLLYAIKQLALDNDDRELRQRLFTLLLDSRYQLAAILAGEVRTTGDPVRALFVETWSELRSILADARYAVFLDAGDALAALDRAAPGLGVTLSESGLRQLARSLRPGASGDPLAYDWAVDPQLGRLFDVEELPRADPLPPSRSWLDLFITSAYAAEGRSLDRWIPSRAELHAYEARVSELLHRNAATELQRSSLAEPYDKIYRHLVPTTALIESCWRQYVLRGEKVAYLRSATGSVGIMQINQHVWRGFYDIERLRWDTAYNVRAGAQILMRYVKDYAIPYAARTGDLDHVPRAAYAVYNAGPRAAGRFTKNPPHPREARVDGHLWTLYQGIAAGGQADLRTCGVSTAAASR